MIYSQCQMDERGKDSFDSKKSNDSNKKGVVQEKFESWKKAGKAVRKLLSSVNRNQHQSKGMMWSQLS